MLGRYENFPKTIHGIARVSCQSSRKTMQRAFASALCQISKKRFELNDVVRPSSPRCSVNFEFGVGEDGDFTFFDDGELKNLRREIQSGNLRLMDFLCILQYYRVQESGEHTPLKADYYMLRFVFGRRSADILVSHERGPRRVHTEDFIRFLLKRAEARLPRNTSLNLNLQEIRTV